MKRLFCILAGAVALYACKEDDSEKKARLYALDDIQGFYETVSITWEGESAIDLNGDGTLSFDLLSELDGIDPNVNPAELRSEINTDAWHKDPSFDGNLALAFPIEDIYLRDGNIDYHHIRKSPIDILFRMEQIGQFRFEHFDFIGKIHEDVPKPDWGDRIGVATFEDGDVVSCNNGIITFRVKKYLVFDIATESLITGPASIVIKKIPVS